MHWRYIFLALTHQYIFQSSTIYTQPVHVELKVIYTLHCFAQPWICHVVLQYNIFAIVVLIISYYQQYMIEIDMICYWGIYIEQKLNGNL